MELSVYVLGDIDFSYRILMGINMLYQQQSMHLMAGTLLILYVMWAFIKWALNPEKSPYPFREFAFGIIFYMIFGGLEFISPRVDVRLETDVYQGALYQTRVAPDIPILAAAPAWITTSLFKGLRETISPLLYVPGEHTGAQYPGMSSGLDPLALLVRLNGMSISTNIDSMFQKNIKEYTTSCLVPFYEMNGDPTSADMNAIIKEPVESFWAEAAVNVNWLFTKYYTPANPSGESKSCDLAYADITAEIAVFQPKLIDYLTANNISSGDISSSLAQVMASFTNPTMPTPYEFMTGKFMATYFNEGLYNSGFSNVEMMGNKMMFEASQKRVFDRAGESNMFVQIMIPVITAIEAFAFFIAPVLMLLTVMGGVGISYIGKYLMLTLFINLWSFIKIFTDFFMLVTVSKAFNGDLSIDNDFQPFNLANQYSTFMELENFIGIAASLTSTIPFFAMFLLYGGVHSVMGVMRSMTGGSVNASNMAPTITTAGENGVLTAGDQKYTHVASTGHNALTHDVSTSAKYGVDNISTNLSGAATNTLTSANGQLNENTSQLGKSVNNMFQSARTGTDSNSSSDKDSLTLSRGSELINNVANGMNVSASKDKMEQAQSLARMSAAIALQLKAGGGGKGPNADQFTDNEIRDAATKVGKGFGLSGDLTYQAAQQLANNDTQALSKSISKAYQTLDTEKSGESYSQGFDFSQVKTSANSGSVSDTASTVESNVETVSRSQSLVNAAQDMVQTTDSIGQNKSANWAVVGSVLDARARKDGAQSSFDSVFDQLSDKAKSSLKESYMPGENPSDTEFYLNLGGDNGFNPTNMLKAALKESIRTGDYETAMEIYQTAAPLAGDHSSGFMAAANGYKVIDQVDDKIKEDANNPSKPNITMTQPNTGEPPKYNDIKNEAEAKSNPTIKNQAAAKAEQLDLADKNGDRTTVSPANSSNLSMGKDDKRELQQVSERLDERHDLLKQSAALLPGIKAIEGITGAIQDVSDYINWFTDKAWGTSAESKSANIAALSNKAGYASGELYEGLKNLQTFGNDEFRNLKEGLKNGDVEAYKTLSALNDASILMTNTDVGNQVFDTLDNKSKEGFVNAIEQTNKLVSGLGEDSPISTKQMNAITDGRMSAELTDKQADKLIETSITPDKPHTSTATGITPPTNPDEAMRSLIFSAAKGQISDNPVLLDMVMDNQSKYQSFVSSESMPDLIEKVRSQGNSENVGYANSYSNDVTQDQITNVLRGGMTGLYNDGSDQGEDPKQGVNVQTVSPETMNGMLRTYATSLTEQYSEGGYKDYKSYNDKVISTAMGDGSNLDKVNFAGEYAMNLALNNPLGPGIIPNWIVEQSDTLSSLGDASDERLNRNLPLANQQAALSISIAAASISEYNFGNLYSGVEGAGQNIKDGLLDLGSKARQTLLVMENPSTDLPDQNPNSSIKTKNE